MASPSTETPSPRRYDLRIRFQQPIEAAVALEKREAVLRRENEALLSEMRSLKRLNADYNRRLEEAIDDLNKERGDFEDEVGRLKSEMKDRVSELLRRIEVFEEEKTEMEADLCKVKSENEKIPLLVEKNRVLEKEKIPLLVEKNRLLEKEKNRLLADKVGVEELRNRMEAELKKEICELRNEKVVLEKEMDRVSADLCKVKSENEKIPLLVGKNRVLEKEKIPLLVEKNRLLEKEKNCLLADKVGVEELRNRMEAELKKEICELRNEKVLLETKFCQAKTTMEEERAAIHHYEKKIMELDDRIIILQRGKQMHEQLIQFVDLTDTDDVGTLSTPWHKEGRISAAVAGSSENSRCKRRRSPCEKNIDGSYGGEVKVGCEWEAAQELLDAFDVNPELCLKAVCALYRKHKRLHETTNASLLPGASVFKLGYLSKGESLGKYLTEEDTVNRRMKKLVGQLEKIDVLAVCACRDIAKEHYKQVFEIYKKKEDPLYLS